MRKWIIATLYIAIPVVSQAAGPTLEPKVVQWVHTTVKTKCVKQKPDPLADPSSDDGIENAYDCGKTVHLAFKISKGANGPFLWNIRVRSENRRKMTPTQVQGFMTQMMSWLSEDGLLCVAGTSDKSNEQAYVCQSRKRDNDQTMSVAQESLPNGGFTLEYYFYAR